jgi:hypothetical protein
VTGTGTVVGAGSVVGITVVVGATVVEVVVVEVVVVAAVVVVRRTVVVGSRLVVTCSGSTLAVVGLPIWASLLVQAAAASVVASARVRSAVCRRIRVRSTCCPPLEPHGLAGPVPACHSGKSVANGAGSVLTGGTRERRWSS